MPQQKGGSSQTLSFYLHPKTFWQQKMATAPIITNCDGGQSSFWSKQKCFDIRNDEWLLVVYQIQTDPNVCLDGPVLKLPGKCPCGSASSIVTFALISMPSNCIFCTKILPALCIKNFQNFMWLCTIVLHRPVHEIVKCVSGSGCLYSTLETVIMYDYSQSD